MSSQSGRVTGTFSRKVETKDYIVRIQTVVNCTGPSGTSCLSTLRRKLFQTDVGFKAIARPEKLLMDA